VLGMPWTRSDLDLRSLVADRTTERLTRGDPILGWSGDPYLVLTFNRVDGCWELFRDVGGEVSLVARKHGVLDPDVLIAELVARDSQGRGHVNQVDSIINHNEALMAERARKAEEAKGAMLEHLIFAQTKDGLV
jgi:hypothetical protein